MEYELWLASLKTLSSRKKRMLRELCGGGKGTFYIEETRLKELDFLDNKDIQVIVNGQRNGSKKAVHQGRAMRRIDKAWQELVEQEIQFIPYYEKEYPARLEEITSPPYALYVKGSLPREDKPAIAIVGARRCSPYGEEMALEYGETLARCGIEIISGMAKGIDGAAARGALNGQGRTYAVLGCGVDNCYPREHIGLYMDIQRTGGIIAEQPPGEPPLSTYFPARNRIISALADRVLVMEAKEKSGSLITADMALEQGRDVYALPGPVTSELSKGCHQLIRQGAGILISPEDLLEEMELWKEHFCKKTDENKKMLESTENMVYSCLDLVPKGVDQLIRETGLAPGELMNQLIMLELQGFIKEISKNYYVKIR